MDKIVSFRDFEERDIDFIYRCKNDERLNSMIVGQWRPFSYNEAVNWVHGCKGDNDTFKFWAICTNDDEKKIIGWASIAKIDNVNQSAETHSMVIADPNYHDGFAWLEAHLLMFEYVFEVLKLNRLYGVSLLGHKASNTMGNLLFMKTEGILRQAIYKNDRFYDLQYNGILKSEYFIHKEAGDYEIKQILRRLKNMRKHE